MDLCLDLTVLGQTTGGLPAESDNDNNIYIYCFRIIVLENVDIGHWSTLNYFLSLPAYSPYVVHVVTQITLPLSNHVSTFYLSFGHN